MMTILRYTPALASRWDEFVRNSANGTFLHLRGYMDYHSHRFTDCSLLAFDHKQRLVAMLPANISGDMLYSHQGLTYGGWITARRHFSTPGMLQLWDESLRWMKSQGIKGLHYKPIPWIYARYPSDDDIYALFRQGATMESCMVSSAIPLHEPILADEATRWRVRRTQREGIVVERSHDYAAFMAILSHRLLQRYGAAPVHSTDEITMLARRFPDNIRLILARDRSGEILAGTIIYVTHTTVHTQYIATTSSGRELGVFPAIVHYLINNECQGKRYLDFGTSCLDGGRQLNDTLVQQKYGYGGRPVAHTSYLITV